MNKYTTNDILFDIYYENYAYGYKNSGKLILNNGDVRTYNLNTHRHDDDDDTILIEFKLNNSILSDELSEDMMNKLKNSVTFIKSEAYIFKKKIIYDGGNTYYYLYNKDDNEKILLFQRGDEIYTNYTVSHTLNNTIDLLKILSLIYTCEEKCKQCSSLKANKIDFVLGKLFCSNKCKNNYYMNKNFNT
jgi:hypothetical protein